MILVRSNLVRPEVDSSAENTTCIDCVNTTCISTNTQRVGMPKGMTESVQTPADRLKIAREALGYKSALSFAEAKELTVSTYGSHENGTRNLTNSAAQRYAPLLNVDWKWLMFAE